MEMFFRSNDAPGGQAVSDRFSLGWESVLVSSERFIVARLDGRGSRSQGGRILHGVHKRLGTVDAQDQITALEYVSAFCIILLFRTSKDQVQIPSLLGALQCIHHFVDLSKTTIANTRRLHQNNEHRCSLDWRK